MQLNAVMNELQILAPIEFAESWDNVGLLIGERNRQVTCVMTCLTVTDTTLQEAIDENVSLIVVHHPIPFKPMSRVNSDSLSGHLILRAIESRIAIYSAHTAWDNAAGGINDQLAEMLELSNVAAMQAFGNVPDAFPSVGVGRYGQCSSDSETADSLLERLGKYVPALQTRCTHSLEHKVSKVGIVCGSGGSLLSLVASCGCDAMLTGEATYHQCLEAEQRGIVLMMIGHHASESFAMATLASKLQQQLPSCRVFGSQRESSRF